MRGGAPPGVPPPVQPVVVVLASNGHSSDDGDDDDGKAVEALTASGLTVLVPELLLAGSGNSAGLRLENDRGTAV